MSESIERLHRIPLFRQLDAASLELLDAQMTVHEYQDGEVIFSEQDAGDSLCVLDEGQVVISKMIDWDDMREKTLAVLPQGAFFGEGSLMEDVGRSATVRARGRARVLQLGRQGFLELVQGSPLAVAKLLFSMMKIVNARLRQTSQELVTLYDTGKIAGAGLDLASLVEQILERVVETTGSRKGWLFLENPYTLQLELAGVLGAPPPAPPFDPAKGLFQAVMGEGRTIMKRRFEDTGLERIGFEPEAVLAVPLIQDDAATGLLVLGDREGGLPYNAGHLHLLQGVATQVATAVVNAYRKAEEEAAKAHSRHWVTF